MAFKTEKTYTYNDILNLPDDTRAELIDGQLYLMSLPTSTHQKICGELFFKIHSYITHQKNSCKVFFSPFGVFLDEKTNTFLEPDITMICNPDHLNDQGYQGAPDWIIEVLSPSTYLKDKILKLYRYYTTGVREYWIIDPAQELITVWNFEKETESIYSFSDVIPVGIYEGFSIDFSELDFSIS